MASGAHTAERLVWTAREREVLDLIARGHTNGEIAGELGISFATAKWHVSELITKLGVDSREDVAAYWKRERSARRRVARFAHGLFALPVAKLAAGGATVAGLAVVGGVAWATFATRPGNDSVAAALATASPTATPTPVWDQRSGPPPGCATSSSASSRYCDYKNYPNVADHDKGNCDLSGEPVSGYINQIDLHGCNLRGALMTGATGNNANFSGADLRDANMSGNSTFGRSDFTGANLTGADISGSPLQGANLSNAILLGADLTNTIVRDVRWKNTVCPDGTNSDANGGTCLGTVGVSDYWPSKDGGWVPPVCQGSGSAVQLCAPTFYAGISVGPDGKTCTGERADLHGANLKAANFAGCDLAGADLSGADLEGANLSGANLTGANLSGAKLYLTNAGGTNFSGANLDAAVVSHTALDGADLTGASTAGAMFRPQLRNTICPDGSNSDAPDGDGSTCDNNR